MSDLPKDPVMLLSVVNTKLRDEYGALPELCRAYGVSEEELKSKLLKIDYRYDEDQNRFV